MSRVFYLIGSCSIAVHFSEVAACHSEPTGLKNIRHFRESYVYTYSIETIARPVAIYHRLVRILRFLIITRLFVDSDVLYACFGLFTVVSYEFLRFICGFIVFCNRSSVFNRVRAL